MGFPFFYMEFSTIFPYSEMVLLLYYFPVIFQLFLWFPRFWNWFSCIWNGSSEINIINAVIQSHHFKRVKTQGAEIAVIAESWNGRTSSRAENNVVPFQNKVTPNSILKNIELHFKSRNEFSKWAFWKMVTKKMS